MDTVTCGLHYTRLALSYAFYYAFSISPALCDCFITSPVNIGGCVVDVVGVMGVSA